MCVLLLPLSAVAQWTWTPQTGRWINLKRIPKETPELQLEHSRALMLDGNYGDAMQETEKFTKFYGESSLVGENQYIRAEIQLNQRKLMDAARSFQQIVVNHPDTARYNDAVQQQYTIGEELYEVGLQKQKRWWKLLRGRPLKRAAEVYSMVIENQPFTDEAAEAQYKLGLVQHARKEYVTAALEYRRVVEDYSMSAWVDEATYGLASAYYDGALGPDYDQTPSELTIRAIDDFVNRYPADEKNADLSEKRQEMRNRMAQQKFQTARFYEKRRRFEAARVYYRIIVSQFSDTAVYERAQTWLEKDAAEASLSRRNAS